MKKLILTLAIVISVMLVQAQTDLDIANALIGSNINDMEQIADSLGFEYSYETYGKLFITFDNATKYYKIQVASDRKNNNKIVNIFIRYKLSEHKHIEHYNAYEVPKKTKAVRYKKKMGVNLAHMELKYNKYL